MSKGPGRPQRTGQKMKYRYKIGYFTEDQLDSTGFVDVDDPKTEILPDLPAARQKAQELAMIDINGEVHIDEQMFDHGEWVFTENSWLAYSDSVVGA